MYKSEWAENKDGSEIVEELAIYLDRSGERVQEHAAISIVLEMSRLNISGDIKIDAYSLLDDIRGAAERISNSIANGEVRLKEIINALREKQIMLQEQDDQWGVMTPYLEELLAKNHPNIRLKTAGKYNPDGRRIILIRTRPGDGGWEPAAIEEGKKAFIQWQKAGLDYPFAEKAEENYADNILAEIESRIEISAESSGRSSVNEALAQYRKLVKQLKKTQEALEKIVPLIREKNLEEAEEKVRECRNAISNTLPDQEKLKVRKALVEVALKSVAADRQVDTDNPVYLPFAKILSMIELGIGKSPDKEAVEKDSATITQAAGFARALLNHLESDQVGEQLRLILDRGLTIAEGGWAD